MANFPGPWQVRLTYGATILGALRTHTQRLNCDMSVEGQVGDTFNDFSVITRGGGATVLTNAMTTWLALMDDVYNVNSSFISADLWKYTVGTNDATWYSADSYSISGVDTNGTITAGQVVMTWRSAGGGNMRLEFMETTAVAATTDLPPYPTAWDAIRTHVLGTNNWFLARDNTYPRAAMGLHAGINERWFKKYYR